MRLSIGGLEIRPRVWRKAFEEDGGYDIDAAEDRAAGVALGYVAQVRRFNGSVPALACRGGLPAGRVLQIGSAAPTGTQPAGNPRHACLHPPPAARQAVDRLGRYLGVALRYPLVLRGSRSAVVDCQPPVGAW